MNCKLLLTLIFIGAVSFLYGQDFSNKGKDFWIAYPSHIDGLSSVMGIYITSDVNTNGTIQVGPSSTITFSVTANQVTRKFIGNSPTSDASNSYVLITQQDGVKTNAASLDSHAGAGDSIANTMMPNIDPRPSLEDRKKLSEWLACGTPE